MSANAKDGSLGLGTLLAGAHLEEDVAHGYIAPSWAPTTTYARDDDYALVGLTDYQRHNHPNARAVENLLATLEHGERALLFTSGMGAATSVFHLLEEGSHVILPRVMYWSLRKWLYDWSKRNRIEIDFVDLTSVDNAKRALKPNTKLFWLECPANPTWDVCDIEALSALAHANGAFVAIDSTNATPVVTRPIDFGADFVVHSATKLLNGHSDVLAGAVIAKKYDARFKLLEKHRRENGTLLAPFEAWLLLRGMRTLEVRVRRANQSALEIANALANHPRLERVLYPGLATHPNHEVAKKQMSGGFGAVLSLLVKEPAGSNGDETAKIMSRIRLMKRATSLGGFETLIEQRKRIEGPESPVPDNLIRLSIGLEDPRDLLADMLQALG
ncbi:MAG: PLP-dependent transferase [Polyangiaceae bacterium]|nr:PLP-dependent transferase [Polyangiaceae bacterium]